jgi:hypothetical protein
MSSVAFALIDRNTNKNYQGIDFLQKDVVDVVINHI